MKCIICYFSIICTLVITVACEKNHTGCTDPFAANYNRYIALENSDSSCYYYSKFYVAYTKPYIKTILDQGGERVELIYDEKHYLVYDSTMFDKLYQFGSSNFNFFEFNYEGSLKNNTLYFETKLYLVGGHVVTRPDSIVLKSGDDGWTGKSF